MPLNNVSNWLESLERELKPEQFNNAILSDITKNDTQVLTSLWIAEGIPHAFKDSPAQYQIFRKVLADYLKVSSRDIGLTGSARVGFSLSPSKFLNRYDPSSSDLDLFIVNDELFCDIKEEVSEWMNRIDEYRAINTGTRRFWASNIDNLTSQFKQNYLDSWKIPNSFNHERIKSLHNSFYRFSNLADKAANIPSLGKNNGGLRVYKDWDAAVKQISFSIKNAIKTVYKNS